MKQKVNDSKPHISSLTFDFRLCSKKSPNQQKLAKQVTHFTIKFRSKNLAHFTNLNSLNIIKNILPRHSQNPYSLYKFSSKNVSGWSQKKNISLSPFLDVQELHSQSTSKTILCIFLYISVRKILFQKRRKFLSGGRLSNFLNAARCLDLAKCFRIFYFNWKFWKNPSIALECCNFPDNLDFKGKIETKFLVRSQFLSRQNNMTIKQQINHGVIQKLRHLYNGIFHPIHLSHI